MWVVQQRGRRRCEEPLARTRRCSGCVPTIAHAAKPILDSTRIRSACRSRKDFTGRGFGQTRLREAP